MQMLQIEDRKLVLLSKMKKLQDRIYYLRLAANVLECEYKEKKQEYEQIDKARATIDGRLKKVEGDVKTIKAPKKMSKDELLSLIAELEDMV